MKNEDYQAGFTFILHILLRHFPSLDRRQFADELRRQVEDAPAPAQGMAEAVRIFAKSIEDLEHRRPWVPIVHDGKDDSSQ